MKPPCQYGPTNTFSVSSPIGSMEIVCCPKGLHVVKQQQDISDETFAPKSNEEVRLISQEWQDNGYSYKPATGCIEWLQEYFQNSNGSKLILNRPPICPFVIQDKGSFQEKVWQVLMDTVQAGDCITYGGLAKICENPHASRAVGQAMKNNPIQILVPCHRVIKSDGTLGQYASGTRNSVKEWLLKHEDCRISNPI